MKVKKEPLAFFKAFHVWLCIDKQENSHETNLPSDPRRISDKSNLQIFPTFPLATVRFPPDPY